MQFEPCDLRARSDPLKWTGISHDRKNIEGFCSLHQRQGAKLIVRGGHLSSRCEIPVSAVDSFNHASSVHVGD